MELREHARAGVHPPENVRFGAAVYGSFLVASVVGVAFEAGESAAAITMSALGSMFVFWLAHAWSDTVGERISAGDDFRRRDVVVIARREWPLFEAAVLPVILLALAWAGVWSRETGVVLALGAALVQIAGWGYVAGLRAGGSRLAAAALGAVECLLGVVLLMLERFVH
jgi:hypothetical protein